MKIDRVLELLKIERECVTRQSPCNEKSKLCDRNCGECDIAQNDLELIEMYDFVISMIETLSGRSQWISVKDRLPRRPDWYLVYVPDYHGGSSRQKEQHKGVMFAKWNGKSWGIEKCYYDRPNIVIAWREIPEPPEVKQDEV